MSRLREREYGAVLKFLSGLYAIRDLRAFRRQILSTLPKLVASEITSYNEVNPRQQQNIWCCEPSEALQFPDSAEIFNQHIPEHPLIGHYARTGDSRPLKISDLLTRSQFHRLGLYNEFYRRLGVEHQMAFVFPAPHPLVIGIALNRSLSDFNERERLLLKVVRPHLIQAFQNAKAVTQVLQELKLMRRAFERLDRGIILLTQDGRVCLMNVRAQQYLLRYFGGSVRNERLPAALHEWVGSQQKLLTEAGVPLPRLPLVIRGQSGRLVVRLVSDPDQTLLLLDEGITTVPARRLQQLGLTPREAEVLAWLAQGKSNMEIAAILGASPLTVKKHVEHILEKLGVENRTSAAARALQVA